MDFWIWINYPLNIQRHLDVIYTDFMTITMDKTSKEDSLDIFCVPIEWLYQYSLNETSNSTAYEIINELGASYVKDSKSDIACKWVYVRCGFDLKNNKMYLNDLPESNLKVPQLYSISNQEQTNFPFQMKKFYENDEFVELKLNNFFSETKKLFIYMRNLNIFREYIPQKITTKYWNLYTISDFSDFSQLLFSVPFTATKKDSSFNTYYFYSYNFYTRKGGNNDEPEIKKHTLILKTEVTDLKPPRNFQRLNFLELNKQSKQCDHLFIDMDNINCGGNRKYCFDDNKPFSCKNDCLLDINSLNCNQSCPIGYMHPPRDANNTPISGLYCSEQCSQGSSNCPSEKELVADIDGGFTCDNNNYYELYFNCYHKEDIINIHTGGLFFSETLQSKTIIIDLKQTYSSYAISAWIYYDKRLKQNDNDYLVFMTDTLKIKKNKIIGNNINMEPSDKFDEKNWNHMFLSYEYKTGYSGYKVHLTFKNQIYKNNPTDVNSGNDLNQIYFCRKETYCTDKWVNAFYKDIRIFDIRRSNRYSAFMFEHYGLD